MWLRFLKNLGMTDFVQNHYDTKADNAKNEGLIYQINMNKVKATEYYKKAYDFYLLANNIDEAVYTLEQLIKCSTNNWEKEKYYLKIIEHHYTHPVNLEGITICYKKLADIYKDLGDTKQEYDCIMKLLEWTDSNYKEMLYKKRLASIKVEEKNYTEALHWFDKTNDYFSMCFCFLALENKGMCEQTMKSYLVENSIDYRLIDSLLKATDPIKFVDCIDDYLKIKSLESWKITVLLDLKKSIIAKNEREEEPDLC